MVGVSDALIPSTAIADAETVFTTHYTSLSLAPRVLSAPRTVVPDGPVRLICVGALEQFYKGHDVLVRAVSECVAQGIDLRLTLVGEGRIRASIEALTGGLGIRDRCEFLGQLAEGAAVLRELDHSDIFVLASRSEGLPRAIIEAMARGLPCISTTVGGIPELLPPEDLVPPDDLPALAAKIREVVHSVARREQMSRRNVSVARHYTEEVLQARRVAFYGHIRAVTGENSEHAREHQR
jgi:glycosyltransferase involved in cell wall biosynthesis